eukprot:TRINITY_DN4795_c0_g2_i5.p1 TRINITY_DN4795_c0_g2~~TRINITY_DN4795_c0_g2_i5.p1  ORF type:complete len:1282 (-),score=325.43 TRINITY_DN4795_c0_g2_i5:874-4719(-)
MLVANVTANPGGIVYTTTVPNLNATKQYEFRVFATAISFKSVYVACSVSFLGNTSSTSSTPSTSSTFTDSSSTTSAALHSASTSAVHTASTSAFNSETTSAADAATTTMHSLATTSALQSATSTSALHTATSTVSHAVSEAVSAVNTGNGPFTSTLSSDTTTTTTMASNSASASAMNYASTSAHYATTIDSASTSDTSSGALSSTSSSATGASVVGTPNTSSGTAPAGTNQNVNNPSTTSTGGDDDGDGGDDGDDDGDDDDQTMTTTGASDYSWYTTTLGSGTTTGWTDSEGEALTTTTSDSSSVRPRPSPTYPSHITWKDKGCFQDSTTSRMINKVDFESDSSMPYMDQDLCKAMCAGLGYHIVGLQQNTHCFCASYDRSSVPVADAACQPGNCQNNSTQNCGGELVNHVFHTSDPVPASSPSYEYVGCYRDDIRQGMRDLNMLGVTTSLGGDIVFGMTPRLCISLCYSLGASYAGLQYGSECFCGNSYGRYGSSNWCNFGCQSESWSTCGGNAANDIYYVYDGGDANSGATTTNTGHAATTSPAPTGATGMVDLGTTSRHAITTALHVTSTSDAHVATSTSVHSATSTIAAATTSAESAATSTAAARASDATSTAALSSHSATTTAAAHESTTSIAAHYSSTAVATHDSTTTAAAHDSSTTTTAALDTSTTVAAAHDAVISTTGDSATSTAAHASHTATTTAAAALDSATSSNAHNTATSSTAAAARDTATTSTAAAYNTATTSTAASHSSTSSVYSATTLALQGATSSAADAATSSSRHAATTSAVNVATTSALNLATTTASSGGTKQPFLLHAILVVTSPSTQGGPVTISGQSFAHDNSVDLVLFLDDNAVPLYNSPSSSNAIWFMSPEGTGAGHALRLEVTNGTHTTQRVNLGMKYQAPSITSNSPVTFNGGPVTLSGANFGSNTSVVSILIGSANCTNVRQLMHTSVVCTLPAPRVVPEASVNVMLVVDNLVAPPYTLTFKQSSLSIIRQYLDPNLDMLETSEMQATSTAPTQDTIRSSSFGVYILNSFPEGVNVSLALSVSEVRSACTQGQGQLNIQPSQLFFSNNNHADMQVVTASGVPDGLNCQPDRVFAVRGSINSQYFSDTMSEVLIRTRGVNWPVIEGLHPALIPLSGLTLTMTGQFFFDHCNTECSSSSKRTTHDEPSSYGNVTISVHDPSGNSFVIDNYQVLNSTAITFEAPNITALNLEINTYYTVRVRSESGAMTACPRLGLEGEDAQGQAGTECPKLLRLFYTDQCRVPKMWGTSTCNGMILVQ